MEFQKFPKIPRLHKPVVITEKLDGTNGVIHVDENGIVSAGSRNRWLDRENDNYGFYAWVRDNWKELEKLGPGVHYGEWWGLGIQRGYGLKEKRFSLFNVGKWDEENTPECCSVVPTLYTTDWFDLGFIEWSLEKLRLDGSVAAPGFDNPEGIVIYHTAAKQYFKYTLEGDAK